MGARYAYRGRRLDWTQASQMTKNKIITYAQAQRRKLTRYFTGTPCHRGHLCDRLVSGRSCLLCARASLEKYSQTPKGAATRQRANQSDAGRARAKRYRQSPKGRKNNCLRACRFARTPKGREVQWKYDHSPIGCEKRRRFQASPKGRERDWRYRNTDKGRQTNRRTHHRPEYREQERARRNNHGLERSIARYGAASIALRNEWKRQGYTA